MRHNQILNRFTLFLITALTVTGTLHAEAPSLHDYSKKINADLPETYDQVTKLMRTTVENDDLVFHFLVLARKEEFEPAFPRVKEQVLKTICRHGREGRVLRELRKSVLYRYENTNGQQLGEFMVRPAHCGK